MITEEFTDFALFSEAEVKALEARCSQRESRGQTVSYTTCLVRNKEVQLKSEERVRQLWLARLIEKFGYSPSRIAVE